MADSGEEEENYWPGYVDALTTMTMVLTFVMMVLGVAVFMLSQNVSKVLLETIVEKVDKNIKVTPNTPVQEVIDKLVASIEKAKQQAAQQQDATEKPRSDTSAASEKVEETTIEAKEVAPDEEKPVAAVVSRSLLTLNFQGRGIKIDEETANAISDFSKTSAEIQAGGELEVRAYANVAAGGISEQRRTAYYRAMLARKELLASGIAPERIKVHIEDVTTEETANKVNIFVKS
ncbi:MAG: hypothetical protein R3D02_10970 [Hyphomicrobiales bacterium]